MSTGIEILTVVTSLFLLVSTCYITASLIYGALKIYYEDATKIEFHLFMSNLITGITLLLLTIVGTL